MTEERISRETTRSLVTLETVLRDARAAIDRAVAEIERSKTEGDGDGGQPAAGGDARHAECPDW